MPTKKPSKSRLRAGGPTQRRSKSMRVAKRKGKRLRNRASTKHSQDASGVAHKRAWKRHPARFKGNDNKAVKLPDTSRIPWFPPIPKV